MFGISNEALSILAPQKAAKLPEVKVGDPKKLQESNLGHTRKVQSGPSGKNFFRSPTLNFGSFSVSYDTSMHSISFESPDTEPIICSLKKNFRAG